jgi:nicotinamide phosphoribosyltransferase
MPRPFKPRPLHKTDSYKVGHWRFIVPGTTEMLYYYEARGGEYPYTILFDLQGNIIRNIEGKFATITDVEEAEYKAGLHFMTDRAFNKAGWRHVINKHGGHLPLNIRAVKEGIPVPVKNVMWTMKNTCDQCAWVPGWTETMLEHVWYPSAVVTRSRYTKQIIAEFLAETADDFSTLPYQLHDFGGRGVTCVEQMGIGAAAHLVNFQGTDTLPGIDYIEQFYGFGANGGEMPGYSVFASEHSVTTMWKREYEAKFVENALDEVPTGILSLVGDSYDIFNFTANIIGGTYRERIRNRNGKVVVRPDSGDPVKITLRVLEILGEKFGVRETSNGYKMLPPCVGVLWGDGIDHYGVRLILQAMKDAKWSAANIVFGMGGGLLQKVNRDTQKVAIKCCNAVINGEQVEIWKDPITDPGKASKRGRVALLEDSNGSYRTMSSIKGDGRMDYPFDLLEPTYLDGEVLRFQKFPEIRQLAEVSLEVYA